MLSRKRTLLVGGQKDKKRKKSAVDEHEAGDIDFDADEPAAAQKDNSDEEAELEETAEEKRLRIGASLLFCICSSPRCGPICSHQHTERAVQPRRTSAA